MNMSYIDIIYSHAWNHNDAVPASQIKSQSKILTHRRFCQFVLNFYINQWNDPIATPTLTA